MIINQNDSNTACFRLASKTTLTASTVYYLFKLTNSQTREEVLFTGLDISNNKDLYSEFEITETGSTYVNLTASTISLKPAGFWSYEVYQMDSPGNLDLSLVSGSAIEFGKMQVLKESNIPHGQTYQYTGSTNTRIVYQR